MQIKTIELENSNLGYYSTVVEIVTECKVDELEKHLREKTIQHWIIQSIANIQDNTVILYRKPIGLLTSNE